MFFVEFDPVTFSCKDSVDLVDFVLAFLHTQPHIFLNILNMDSTFVSYWHCYPENRFMLMGTRFSTFIQFLHCYPENRFMSMGTRFSIFISFELLSRIQVYVDGHQMFWD